MWRPPQKSSKSNVRQRHKPVNFDCLLHLIIKIKPQLFFGGNSTLGLHTLISKTDAVLKSILLHFPVSSEQSKFKFAKSCFWEME